MSDAKKPESVVVLGEVARLILKKSHDYQNPNSSVKQADHYPRGCATIADMCHQKLLRMYSVMQSIESGGAPNFESLEDSAKDLIAYASFFVTYARGKMDGQRPDRDFLNRSIKKPSSDKYPDGGANEDSEQVLDVVPINHLESSS